MVDNRLILWILDFLTLRALNELVNKRLFSLRCTGSPLWLCPLTPAVYLRHKWLQRLPSYSPTRWSLQAMLRSFPCSQALAQDHRPILSEAVEWCGMVWQLLFGVECHQDRGDVLGFHRLWSGKDCDQSFVGNQWKSYTGTNTRCHWWQTQTLWSPM